ncbi:recombination regulator RecX [Sphaerisporangium album]|uniref:Regulatory protein RecX n=1 Tax=Sphaerisporangium album TaxID=509200 RepID=A0A367FQ73_9ACTN|nr:recombination regulator RecX [Sphaerisporangium album]RCG32556.1 recombination regulator RecX [Sphaerisporangium album]
MPAGDDSPGRVRSGDWGAWIEDSPDPASRTGSRPRGAQNRNRRSRSSDEDPQPQDPRGRPQEDQARPQEGRARSRGAQARPGTEFLTPAARDDSKTHEFFRRKPDEPGREQGKFPWEPGATRWQPRSLRQDQAQAPHQPEHPQPEESRSEDPPANLRDTRRPQHDDLRHEPGEPPQADEPGERRGGQWRGESGERRGESGERGASQRQPEQPHHDLSTPDPEPPSRTQNQAPPPRSRQPAFDEPAVPLRELEGSYGEPEEAWPEAESPWAESEESWPEAGKSWVGAEGSRKEPGERWAESAETRTGSGARWAESAESWTGSGELWARSEEAPAEPGARWAESEESRAESEESARVASPRTAKSGRRGRTGRRAARGFDGPAEGSLAAQGPPGDPEAVARAVCLRLLTMAPRTRAQLAEALRRRDIPDEAAESVLSRFSDVGLIDDEAFAEAWVTSRHAGRGLARRALAAELRKRGVEEDTVREAIDQIDSDQELETARRLVDRKLPGTRGLEPAARIRRLAGMLARKGYSGGVAYRVVREALESEGQPTDDFPDSFEE